jgi:hypothetical protein
MENPHFEDHNDVNRLCFGYLIELYEGGSITSVTIKRALSERNIDQLFPLAAGDVEQAVGRGAVEKIKNNIGNKDFWNCLEILAEMCEKIENERLEVNLRTYPHLSAQSCQELEYCFTNISRSHRQWMRAQPEVKEESLSDRLLYELKLDNPEVYYKQFNRHEEGKISGSDWKWIFKLDSRCIEFRVQAKKIQEKTNIFQTLSYATNGKEIQIKKLLGDSDRNNALALYCFYSTSVVETSKCAAPSRANSIYLADAITLNRTIVESRLQGATIKNIANELFAVQCLFLGSGMPDFSFEVFLNNLVRLLSYETKQQGSITKFIKAFPPEISDYRNWNQSGAETPNTDNLDAVVVFDLTIKG